MLAEFALQMPAEYTNNKFPIDAIIC